MKANMISQLFVLFMVEKSVPNLIRNVQSQVCSLAFNVHAAFKMRIVRGSAIRFVIHKMNNLRLN